MDNARRILRSSCLLLFLILASACGDGVSTRIYWDLKVSQLPPEVMKTVQQRWPQARVYSATRSLDFDTWGDYWVTLTLPDGQTDYHQISREGIVKDD